MPHPETTGIIPVPPTPHAPATSLELLQTGERVRRKEIIPVRLIDLSDTIIDDDHVEILRKSMREDGQDTEVGVRARLDAEGNIVFDPFEGHHRIVGWVIEQEDHPDEELVLEAAVWYGITEEEYLEKRVQAKGSVPSIQFARIGRWFDKAWPLTDFSKKDISALQAFGIVLKDSETPKVDLTAEEVKEMKKWVKATSSIWERSIQSMYQILRLVAYADPELVKQIRLIKKPEDKGKVMTQKQLGAVANRFRREINYGVQRGILRAALERRLSNDQTDRLAWALQTEITDGTDEDIAYELAKAIDIPEAKKKPKAPHLSNDADQDNKLRHRVAELEAENTALRDERPWFFDVAYELDAIEIGAFIELMNSGYTDNREAIDSAIAKKNAHESDLPSAGAEADSLTRSQVSQWHERYNKAHDTSLPDIIRDPNLRAQLFTGLFPLFRNDPKRSRQFIVDQLVRVLRRDPAEVTEAVDRFVSDGLLVSDFMHEQRRVSLEKSLYIETLPPSVLIGRIFHLASDFVAHGGQETQGEIREHLRAYQGSMDTVKAEYQDRASEIDRFSSSIMLAFNVDGDKSAGKKRIENLFDYNVKKLFSKGRVTTDAAVLAKIILGNIPYKGFEMLDKEIAKQFPSSRGKEFTVVQMWLMLFHHLALGEKPLRIVPFPKPVHNEA